LVCDREKQGRGKGDLRGPEKHLLVVEILLTRCRERRGTNPDPARRIAAGKPKKKDTGL